MAINLTGKDKIKIKNDLVIDGDVVINGGLDAEETTVSVYRLNTATSVNVGTNLNVDENINVSGDIKINGESVVKHLYAHRIDFGEFYDGVDTGYLFIETIYSTSATPFTWTTFVNYLKNTLDVSDYKCLLASGTDYLSDVVCIANINTLANEISVYRNTNSELTLTASDFENFADTVIQIF